MCVFFFFFQAEDGIRDLIVTGVQTCALPISSGARGRGSSSRCRRAGRCTGGRRRPRDRKRGGVGKRGDFGGGRIIKKKKKKHTVRDTANNPQLVEPSRLTSILQAW